MKSIMWLGSTWYHLAVPQSLQCPGPPHMIPLAHYLLCSFTGYTEALALKPTQRGVKSLVTSERRAKNPGSSCSSLDACVCFASLLWKDLLALGKVNRANMYSPFREQVQSALGRLRKGSSYLFCLFQYILLNSF